MHKIDRGAPPECLGNYDIKTHSWKNLGADCKREIRIKLIEISGGGCNFPRCTYCEGFIYNTNQGHIEHFRRKNENFFPKLTFDWDNLFFSCDGIKGENNHCGHFKDRNDAPRYNPDILIKPDTDDPDDFFYFHSDGMVRPRCNLSSQDQNRASMTINVFGLNSPILIAKRSRAVDLYKSKLDEINELYENFSPEEVKMIIEDEILKTQSEAYCTTIKHFFQKI